MRGARRHILVLVMAALAAAGCSVQHDAAPRVIDRAQVPFGLLATSTTTSTTIEPTAPTLVDTPISIFLIDRDTELLTEVIRMANRPPSVRVGLQELLLGPTEEELARGLDSAIARDTILLGVNGPSNGVVTVDLSDDLRTIGGQGQRLALAQVVFTATAKDTVSGVLFAFDGRPSEVPNGQGVSTAEPLGRADFAVFDPAAPAPPED